MYTYVVSTIFINSILTNVNGDSRPSQACYDCLRACSDPFTLFIAAPPLSFCLEELCSDDGPIAECAGGDVSTITFEPSKTSEITDMSVAFCAAGGGFCQTYIEEETIITECEPEVVTQEFIDMFVAEGQAGGCSESDCFLFLCTYSSCRYGDEQSSMDSGEAYYAKQSSIERRIGNHNYTFVDKKDSFTHPKHETKQIVIGFSVDIITSVWIIIASNIISVTITFVCLKMKNTVARERLESVDTVSK